MKKTLLRMCTGLFILVLSLSALSLSFVAADMHGESIAQVLGATNMDGLPQDVAAEDWFTASAFAIATPDGDNHIVTVSASGLVPDGVYTLWWVNVAPEMSMGPSGGADDNAFTADANGNGQITITVSADNDYQVLVLAYHADGNTYGDSPGEMGVVTFGHVVGGFPSASAMALSSTVALTPTDMDGLPEGADADTWLAAELSATVTMGMDGNDSIVLRGSGLVPDGVYTLWWVNNMMDMANMSMGPVGGSPANEFIADADGDVFAFLNVPSDNDYQTLVVAYHADGNTYGDNPGEMGVITFGHLMGAFPGPGGAMGGASGALVSTDMDGLPDGVTADAWLGAKAVLSTVSGMESDTLTVHASGLVPSGVYTLWWVNNMMDMDNMSMGPAGGPIGNIFVADANGNGFIATTIPAGNDYQTLVIAYHADGNTYGDNPGEMGVVTFGHLMGAFPSGM